MDNRVKVKLSKGVGVWFINEWSINAISSNIQKDIRGSKKTRTIISLIRFHSCCCSIDACVLPKLCLIPWLSFQPIFLDDVFHVAGMSVWILCNGLTVFFFFSTAYIWGRNGEIFHEFMLYKPGAYRRRLYGKDHLQYVKDIHSVFNLPSYLS